MVGWHHQLNGHQFEQTPRVGDGQGQLGVLQSMGSQRVRHNLVSEQQQKLSNTSIYNLIKIPNNAGLCFQMHSLVRHPALSKIC